MLQVIHHDEKVIILNTEDPVDRRDLNMRKLLGQELQIFVVTIGLNQNYVSYRGTREYYSTCRDKLIQFEGENKRLAKWNNDEAIENKLVYAYSRADVLKVYN
jgi:hypothetical protein